MTRTEADALIASATSLRGLRDACREIEAAATENEIDAERIYDATSLPTFGGDEPYNTAEIWSWDATHMLAGTGPDVAVIVARD